MKPLKLTMALLALCFFSCKSPTERWLSNLADFKEIKDRSITMQIMKIKPGVSDTTSFSYKVRIYLPKVENGYHESVNFYYHMDSCFVLNTGKSDYWPVIVQPVNNGIANCYEYLLSFDADKAIKLKHLRLIYKDRFIDGKEYAVDLNK